MIAWQLLSLGASQSARARWHACNNYAAKYNDTIEPSKTYTQGETRFVIEVLMDAGMMTSIADFSRFVAQDINLFWSVVRNFGAIDTAVVCILGAVGRHLYATRHKVLGNVEMKRKRYTGAVVAYTQALEYCRDDQEVASTL